MAQILILEDDKRQFQFTKLCAENKGHKVTWTTSAGEAMNLLNSYSFDLIISSVHMESEDVMDFLREVKTDEKLQAIPFVFSCADAERNERYAPDAVKSSAIALGALKYIQSADFEATNQFGEDIEQCLPTGALKKDVLGGPVKTYSLALFSADK